MSLLNETIVITRKEANFDRACDEAGREAIRVAGIDEYGHFTKVPGAERSTSSLVVKFVGYVARGSMSGVIHEYTFKVTVQRGGK